MKLAALRSRAAAALMQLRHTVVGNVPDALLLAGAGNVAYGAWLIYPPAGFITGGVLLIVGGIIASRGGAS